jgi:hypothetical protein
MRRDVDARLRNMIVQSSVFGVFMEVIGGVCPTQYFQAYLRGYY